MVGMFEYFDLSKRVYTPPVGESHTGAAIAVPVAQIGAKKAGISVPSVSTSGVNITKKLRI